MAKRIGHIVVKRMLDNDPDLSYLTQDYGDCPPEEAERYRQEDRERLAAYDRGEWWMVGIWAEATILTGGPKVWVGNCIRSGGLWGIESDSSKEYFREVAQDELANLRDILLEMGFSEAEIDAAFENVEERAA